MAELFETTYIDLPFLLLNFELLKAAVSKTSKRIYINLLFTNDIFEKIPLQELLSSINQIYSQVLLVSLFVDPIVLLPISKNVLAEGSFSIDARFYRKGSERYDMIGNVFSIDIDTEEQFDIPYQGKFLEVNQLNPRYKKVACGGTFDHFHSGHKILLSAAVLIASEEVIVGITDGDLLKNKKFKEVMQSYDYRQSVVRSFLTMFNPALRYTIPQLLDVGGPTLSDSSIDALSVSEETLSGATYINQEREKKGWKPLAVEVIKLVSNHSSLAADTKLSSTSLRQQEYESLKLQGKL